MSTYLKPPAILRVANPVLTFIGFPTLTIRGRKTGKRRTVPLNVLEREGRRYLMAPRGQTRWALNLRANPDCEIRRRGQKRSYRAVEITDLEEKKALIDAYLQRWRSQVRSEFTQLPDPADHPVFRLEETTPA